MLIVFFLALTIIPMFLVATAGWRVVVPFWIIMFLGALIWKLFTII